VEAVSFEAFQSQRKLEAAATQRVPRVGRAAAEQQRREAALANALLWDLLAAHAHQIEDPQKPGVWHPLVIICGKVYVVVGNPYLPTCRLFYLVDRTATEADRGGVHRHRLDMIIWADGIIRFRKSKDDSSYTFEDLQLLLR
jgi:hypothetical protein